MGSPTDRRWRTTPLIRVSRPIASNLSPSSRMLSRCLPAKRCQNGRGGSGSAGRSSSTTNRTNNSGGLPTERRTLEMSHHSQRKGYSSTPFSGEVYVPSLDDLRDLQALVDVLAEPSRSVHVAHVLVVRNPGEEVMRAGRDVGAVRPLAALQVHVTLFLLCLEASQQRRHAVPRRVLHGERDEDEPDAEQTQLVPRDGVLLVEPLERGRVVEREARLRKALADLGAERLRRPALGRRKLAPQEVGNAAVEVAQAGRWRARGRASTRAPR